MTTQIPQSAVTVQTLAEWFNAKKELAALKSKEALLRSTIVKHFFPSLVEGTNKQFDKDLLGEGYRIVAKVPYTREVDPGILEALIPQMRQKGIVVENLFRWKPELELKEYRKLTEEEMHLVDQCLTIKEGSPQVVIEPKTSRD